MKFHAIGAKGLKLKVRKSLGLIPTFVEVTGKKTGRERAGILNRVKKNDIGVIAENKEKLITREQREVKYLIQVISIDGEEVCTNIQLGFID